jgi:hypothetical protein
MPFNLSVSEIETDAKNIIDMKITIAMIIFMATSTVMTLIAFKIKLKCYYFIKVEESVKYNISPILERI